MPQASELMRAQKTKTSPVFLFIFMGQIKIVLNLERHRQFVQTRFARNSDKRV
jgi:hypothetical protein